MNFSLDMQYGIPPSMAHILCMDIENQQKIADSLSRHLLCQVFYVAAAAQK